MSLFITRAFRKYADEVGCDPHEALANFNAEMSIRVEFDGGISLPSMECHALLKGFKIENGGIAGAVYEKAFLAPGDFVKVAGFKRGQGKYSDKLILIGTCVAFGDIEIAERYNTNLMNDAEGRVLDALCEVISSVLGRGEPKTEPFFPINPAENYNDFGLFS